MTVGPQPIMRRLDRALYRKPIEGLRGEAAGNGMRRVLGPFSLMSLGVGCILGAGIYVMTGNAAANFAGPAVVLSFALAGATCALTAFCYAELASAMPVSGSSYSYCYATLGEGAAWVVGWLLILEYGLAASVLAAGWSGYLVSLLASFGVHVPAAIATPLLDTVPGAASGALHLTGSVNLLAAVAIMAVALLLTRGVTEAAWVNTLMVVVKTGVLLIFVAAGLHAIKPANWTPFVPPNQGGFAFGWPGVLRAASILFFAYFGFETVSMAAFEARRPERDMPFGILGSLTVCTVLYIVVSLVLTGVASYRALGVADPIAVAVDKVGWPALAVVVKLGALTGLSSVLLVNAYGLSRVAFAMAGDGLLPSVFGRLNPATRTPGAGALWLGGVSATAAALLPIRLLGDLVSFGTALAFSIVGLSVIWLRNTRPELERPFRVPFGGFRVAGVWIGWIPLAAIAMCWTMMAPVLIDLVRDAFTGNPLPPGLLVGYAVLGAALYYGFGQRAARRDRYDENQPMDDSHG